MQEEYKGYVTRYRLFRLRHGISLAELARAARVSEQRISGIELMDCAATPHVKKQMTAAMERVLAARGNRMTAVWTDYCREKERLFEAVRETAYE